MFGTDENVSNDVNSFSCQQRKDIVFPPWNFMTAIQMYMFFKATLEHESGIKPKLQRRQRPNNVEHSLILDTLFLKS